MIVMVLRQVPKHDQNRTERARTPRSKDKIKQKSYPDQLPFSIPSLDPGLV